MLKTADEFIDRAAPLLVPGGQIMIMVTNERGLAHAAAFGREFAQQSARLLDPSAWVTEIHYVPASRMRWAIYRALGRLLKSGDAVGWSSPVRLAGLALVAAPLTAATFLTNLGIRARVTPPRGLWSSVFLILRPSGADPTPLRRLATPAAPPRIPGEATGEAALPAAGAAPRQRDPRRLVRTLARYRCVAEILDRRRDIAEYGCVEALGGDRGHPGFLVAEKVNVVGGPVDDPVRDEGIPASQREPMPGGRAESDRGHLALQLVDRHQAAGTGAALVSAVSEAGAPAFR